MKARRLLVVVPFGRLPITSFVVHPVHAHPFHVHSSNSHPVSCNVWMNFVLSFIHNEASQVGLRKPYVEIFLQIEKAAMAEVVGLRQEGEPPRSKSSGEVQALFFARAQELAGVSETMLEIQEGWTTANCFEAVVAKFPALKAISSCLIVALNHDYVMEPVPVKDGDELALIPPISGG